MIVLRNAFGVAARRGKPGLASYRAVASVALAACSGVDGPRLDSVTPQAARRGAEVVIAGERFCDVVDAGCTGAAPQVAFGLDPQVRATLVTVDPARVRVIVPQASEVGASEIVVTAEGRSSNALAFEVLP